MNSALDPFTRLQLQLPVRSARTRSFQLQRTFSLALAALIIVLGGTLAWHNYEKGKVLSLLAVGDAFDRSARQASARIGELYKPVNTLIDVASKVVLPKAGTLQHRLELTQLFGEALRQNPQLDAVFVGYENGDLSYLRTMRGRESLRAEYAAPELAQFVLRTIASDASGSSTTTTFYLDIELQVIGIDGRFNSDYDPRHRPWYQAALRHESRVSTGLYTFFSSGLPGTTVARRLADGTGVVAVDITLEAISSVLTHELPVPGAQSLIFDEGGRVLAQSHGAGAEASKDDRAWLESRIRRITDVTNPLIRSLYRSVQRPSDKNRFELEHRRQSWYGSVNALNLEMGERMYLATIAPQRELLAPLTAIVAQVGLISLVLLGLSLIVARMLSQAISRPIRELSSAVGRVGHLELDEPIAIDAAFAEVAELVTSIAQMQQHIRRFLTVHRTLSEEGDPDRSIEYALREIQSVCGAEFGLVALVSETGNELHPTISHNTVSGLTLGGKNVHRMPYPPVHLPATSNDHGGHCLEAYVVERGETVVINEVSDSHGFNMAAITARNNPEVGFTCRCVLVVPLRDSAARSIGIVELVNPERHGGFDQDVVKHVEALASLLSRALQNQHLGHAHRGLRMVVQSANGR